jgi:hypothetical protein
VLASFGAGLGAGLFDLPTDDIPAVAFAVTFYLYLITHASWRVPARILLLRPFDQPAGGSALRRCIRRHVTFYGHVYTLANSALTGRRRPFLWSRGDTFLWGWPAFILGFKKTVTHDFALQQLKSALNNRLVRNINWSMSVDGIFKVSVDDTHWQRALQLLATSADVILVELSMLGPGLEWELKEIAHYGLESRTIFMSAMDFEATARRQLEATTCRGRPFFTYDSAGRVQDAPRFADALIRLASGSGCMAPLECVLHSGQRAGSEANAARDMGSRGGPAQT